MDIVNKRSILVVDDDPLTREVLEVLVEGMGYQAIVCESGEQALAKVVGARNLCLGLLDIMMPGMNGYSLVERLKEIEGLQTLPIIFVTAKDTLAEQLEGYKSGGDYYLKKPFSKDQLMQAIRMFVPDLE